MSERHTLTGLIEEREDGDVVYVGDEGLAEWLAQFTGKRVDAGYAFSPEPIDAERVEIAKAFSAVGLHARYEVAWSEVTGYLWTDEEGVLRSDDGGSHDLVEVFRAHLGEHGYVALTVREQ